MATFGEYTVCDVAATTDRFVLYRARDSVARTVFIKVTRSGATLNDLSAISAEFHTARGFDTPAIPKALRLDSTSAGEPFQVREDVSGSSLEQRLAAPGPLPSVSEALLITLRILKAIRSLHDSGVAHCDLRPMNLLYDPEAGAIRIIDLSLAGRFGCARRLDPAAVTPYHAPEQSRQGAVVDARADFFALGIILHRLLTGELPRAPRAPLRETPREPSRVPPQLAALVAKLLEEDPARRYGTQLGIEQDLSRCMREWRALGVIGAFPLGMFDQGEGVRFPREVVGCHAARGTLREAFWAASDGTPGIILLAGLAGSGKSTLLAEFGKNVGSSGAVVVTGAWTELDQNIPFRGLSAVCSQLVDWWRALGPTELIEREEELKRVLGDGAGVVTQAFPQLEAILGVQAAPVAVGNVERQNRLFYWLGRLLNAIGRSGRPLVLLLEDLHWADASSLKVLERLTVQTEHRSVLVVGTFRTARDGGPGRPELEALASPSAHGQAATILLVSPFQSADTEAFLEQALNIPAVDSAPLAAVLNQMSLGNPLMLREIVASLVARGIVRFEPEEGRWTWQMDRIKTSQLPDDVAEILADRLSGLAPPALEAISAAACVGRQFSLHTVAALLQRTDQTVRDALAPCERAGFITLVSAEHEPLETLVFLFRHDRVQDACYRSLRPLLQLTYHAWLGKALLDSRPSGDGTTSLFEALAHLNRSHGLGAATADADLCRLNLQAALKARSTTAYDTAAHLLRAAAGLLPPDPWTSAPELTYEVFVVHAECEYLSGEEARAQQIYGELLAHVADRDKRAGALLTRMKMHSHAGRFLDAINDGLACLQALGVNIPEVPKARHVLGPLLRLFARGGVRTLRTERTDRTDLASADLASAGLATLDRRTDTIMACLAELWGPAFWVDDNLTGVVIFTMVRLSLRYGNTAASSIAYASYGAFLANVFGRRRKGREICRFGIQIAENAGDPLYRGRSLFMYTGFFAHQEQSLQEHLQAFRGLVTASRQCGDYPYAGAASLMLLYLLGLGGRPFPEVLAEARAIRDIARQTGHDRTMIALEMLHRWVAILEGRSEYAPARFTVDIFAPGRAYENERGAFYLFECTLLFLLEDYPAAEMQIARLAGNKLVTGYFRPYHAFIAALLLEKLGARSQAKRGWRRQFRAHHRLVEREARLAPQNYLHKALLLRAVAAARDGRHAEAARWFDQAVTTAQEHGFPHHAAIAAELAADHHQQHGDAVTARRHILNARLWYQQWGCLPKLGGIDRRYADLLTWSAPAPAADSGAPGWPTELVAVIAASRALSEETDAGRLVDHLMTSIIEHTGASRAILFTRKEGELGDLVVDCQRSAPGFAPGLAPAGPPEATARGEDVPWLVVNYVDRLKRPLLVSRAQDDELFGRDPYFISRPTAAIMCLSLMRMNESLGVLLLEKEHGATFRHSNLLTADILAAQAAITLNSVREREERLAALQTQMNPHFLFNALNSVAELTVTNPAAVEAAILRLSALYRSVLETSRHKAVPLKKELELVESYLALEKLRFGKRFCYEIATEGDLSGVLIPPLLIQPLVENGVNHGIAWNSEGGLVRVQATVHSSRVHVRVTDTGGGDAVNDSHRGLKMGLATIRRRLELFFGRETELLVTRGSGMVVDLFFPARPTSSMDRT